MSALPLLEPADQEALARAVTRLERSNFAIRLAEKAAQPINHLLNRLPRVANERVRKIVHAVMLRCLRVAIRSLDKKPAQQPSNLKPKVIAGFTGGISGFVGLAALPIELPATTTAMLQAIAEIARAEGEDLGDRGTQVACLEVFALGGGGEGGSTSDAGYYALRTVLTRATGDAVGFLVQRGVLEETAPALMRFVAEIATRYGFVVSERMAASAIPVIGAVGGATINWIFMDYFQEIARGHFAIRRLERIYGAGSVQAIYQEVVRRMGKQK